MKRTSSCRHALGALALLIALLPLAAARAQSEHEEAVSGATHLLRMAMQTPIPEQRDELIRELRRMKDRSLEPLYRAMAKSPDEGRRAHAMLALVELGLEKNVDLNRLATIKERGVQFAVIRQMADDGMLDETFARAALANTELQDATRLIAGVWLIDNEKDFDNAIIEGILDSQDFHVRHIAAALLTEKGNAKAAKMMEELNASQDSGKDKVREDLLLTAAKYDMVHLGPWALSVAKDEESIDTLRFAALEVAIKLGAPGAIETWQEMYGSSTRYAQKLRMALILLGSAKYVQPTVFNAMTGEQSQVLVKMGKIGQAISGKRKDIANLSVSMIQDNYVPANVVLLNYAVNDASPADARAILLGLILTVNSAERDVERLFNQAQNTATAYFEKYHDQALIDLREILARASTDPLVAKAIVYGMLESDLTGADDVVRGLPEFDDRNTQRIAILLLARSGSQLDEEQLGELRNLVRGGGKLRQRVRMQAAWSYLKLTGEQDKAVLEVIKRP